MGWVIRRWVWSFASLASLACALVMAGSAPVSAQSEVGLYLDGLVKVGLEADSNPDRLTGGGSDVDVVERLFVELSLVSRSVGQLVSGLVRLGAKHFHRTTDENAVVFDADGSFRRLLVPDFGFYVQLQARNRTERGHLRDYVRVGGYAGLFATAGRFSLSAAPSLSYFLYRPDGELSHVGVGAVGQVAWTPSDVVGAGLSYMFERRTYAQAQVVSDAVVGLTLAEESDRVDRTHLSAASLTLQLGFLTRLELLWQRNLSNSFGKAFSRLTGRVSVTAALPLELWATAQVSVQRTLFDDNVLVDPTFAIDEENRNAVALSVTGDLTNWLRWEARYNLYTQEFGGDDASYVRHLWYGGFVAVMGD
jgi:hypothetical protein